MYRQHGPQTPRVLYGGGRKGEVTVAAWRVVWEEARAGDEGKWAGEGGKLAEASVHKTDGSILSFQLKTFFFF